MLPLRRGRSSDALILLLRQAQGCYRRCTGQQGAQTLSVVLPAAAAGPWEAVANWPPEQQQPQQQQWLQPYVLQLFQQIRQPGVICDSTQIFVSTATYSTSVSGSKHTLKHKVQQIVSEHIRTAGPQLQTPDTVPAARQHRASRRQHDPPHKRKRAPDPSTSSISSGSRSTTTSNSQEQLLAKSWPPGNLFLGALVKARRYRRPGQLTAAHQQLQTAQRILLTDLATAPPAAVSRLLNAYTPTSRQPQQHQMLQLLQHVSSRAAECSWEEVSALIHGARLAGISQQQQQQLLLPLLQHVQLPATADGTAVRTMLLAHRLAGQAPSAQQQELLLQQLAGCADRFTSVHEIAGLVHSAKLAGCALSSSNLKQHVVRLLDRACSLVLQAPNAATSEDVRALLQAFEVAGLPVPQQQLQDLVRARLPQIEAGQKGLAEVFRILRSVTWSRLRLQESVLEALIQPLLEAPSVQAGSLIKVLRGISYSNQPVSDQLLTAIVDRILHQQAQQQQQQQQPIDPDIAAEQSTAILKAANCLGLSLPQQQCQQLLQPLLHQALDLHKLQYIPPILISLSRMDTMRLPPRQLLQLLADAVAALEQAAAAKPPTIPPPWQQQLSSSSSGGLSAALVADLVRAIGHQQSQIPRELARLPFTDQVAAKIYPSVDLVQPLTESFLAQQPSLKEIADYLAALAIAQFSSLSASMDLVRFKGSVTPGQLLQIQQQIQQQQQQQIEQLGGPEVGNLLWAITSMGYCLPHRLALALGQQVLAKPHPPVSSSVTQTLWTLATAPHAAADAAATESLIRRLITLQLQDYRSKQRQSRKDFWQLSLSAWAAAVCDAVSCKDIVLDLCKELAQPAAWEALREPEHVQLTFIHLWLCGLQWSAHEGLVRCFSPDQIQTLLETRQQQAKANAAGAVAAFEREFGQEAVSNPAKVVRQRQGLPSWQEITQYCPAGADISNLQLKQLNQVAPARYNQGVLFVSVSELPFIKTASLEQLTDDGLFSIDTAAETHDGVRLAIEFDGPYHYAVEVVGKAAESSGQSAASITRPVSLKATGRAEDGRCSHVHTIGSVVVRDVRTRSTEFRDRALAARGYTVVPVYFRDWPLYGSQEEQKQYACDVITAALEANCTH